jgi:hypothetical protein
VDGGYTTENGVKRRRMFWLPLQTSISFEVVGIRMNSMTMTAVPRREERYEYVS